MGKYVDVGVGFSENKDGFKAAKEAAAAAVKEFKGKPPTISYVFFSGDYDVEKLNKGLLDVLKGSEFIGGSTDAVYFNEKVSRNGVVVASIKSDYLHVGIASIDNVSSDPYGVARKAISDSLSKLPVDKYVDPYIQFKRMQKGSIKWMLKLPSFFVTVLMRGMKMPKMGDETKMIKGIAEEIGLNVPIWGGALGTHLEKVFSGKPYEIYVLHSGKILKDGIVIAVNSCSLVYGQSLDHGVTRTSTLGSITGVAADGYVVTSISGMNPVDWYAKSIKVSKEEFMKNAITLSQAHPLGVPDNYGGWIVRAGSVPVMDGKALAFTAPFVEGWPIYVMDASPEKLLSSSKAIKADIDDYNQAARDPQMLLAGLCASRRAIMGDGITKELKELRKVFKNAPMVGWSCFSEIGAKRGKPPACQHLCANVFALYDELLYELK